MVILVGKERATANDFLFTRDEKNIPLPLEVEIEEIGKTILVVPMPIGKMQKYLRRWMLGKSGTDLVESDISDDIEIVLQYMVDPVITREEAYKAGNKLIGHAAEAILEVSGIPIKSTFDEVKKNLARKSNGPKKRRKKTMQKS